MDAEELAKDLEQKHLAVADAALEFTSAAASPGDRAACFLVDANLYRVLKDAVRDWKKATQALLSAQAKEGAERSERERKDVRQRTIEETLTLVASDRGMLQQIVAKYVDSLSTDEQLELIGDGEEEEG